MHTIVWFDMCFPHGFSSCCSCFFILLPAYYDYCVIAREGGGGVIETEGGRERHRGESVVTLSPPVCGDCNRRCITTTLKQVPTQHSRRRKWEAEAVSQAVQGEGVGEGEGALKALKLSIALSLCNREITVRCFCFLFLSLFSSSCKEFSCPRKILTANWIWN